MIFNLVHADWIEPAAVILAIAYLLLAVNQNISCWFAAFFSSLLYFFVMYYAGLYMEAGLQIFYCIMAVYGWTQWRVSLPDNKKFLVKTWNRNQHIKAISLIFLLAFASGWALEKFTNAALPFIDSLTTWGAIVTTYMVAKRLLENWDLLVCNRHNFCVFILFKRTILNFNIIFCIPNNYLFWL